MRVVWAKDGPVTGRQVVDELTQTRSVAYTTVLTVMDRLARKGLLVKEPSGRAHTYRARQSQEAFLAVLMARVLGDADDHAAVLLRFIEQLPPADAERLRAALEQGRGRPSRGEEGAG